MFDCPWLDFVWLRQLAEGITKPDTPKLLHPAFFSTAADKWSHDWMWRGAMSPGRAGFAVQGSVGLARSRSLVLKSWPQVSMLIPGG